MVILIGPAYNRYKARLFGDAPADKTDFEPFVERHAGFVSVRRVGPTSIVICD